MPLREINKKFTNSELVLMGWRSQEMSRKFKQKLNQTDSGKRVAKRSGKKRKQYDGIGPNDMPDHFFDENGDFNLSKVTGEEARRYFEMKLGLPMPPAGMGPGRSVLGYQ